MATMVKLLLQKDEIITETYHRINEAEEKRKSEFDAVLKIQAWFRGQRVRKYLSHLNSCAVAIQRRWRGFLGRKYYRDVLKKHVFVMKLNYYCKMATLVQKAWRGYYTRKYISNYYSRKRYLEGLKIKNEIIRNELEEYEEQQQQTKEMKKDIEEKKKLDEFARKNHFLVSTEVCPGVYNSPYQPYPDEMEFYLRNAKMISPSPPSKPKKERMYDPGCKRYDLPKLHEPLPPVASKPQGPFREPQSVQSQRYKPFQPSLRVQTNFFSLDEARQKMKDQEWVTRLNDTIFVPFKQKDFPYEKLLHSSSNFGHLPYGTKYFRHEFPDKWLHGTETRKHYNPSGFRQLSPLSPSLRSSTIPTPRDRCDPSSPMSA